MKSDIEISRSYQPKKIIEIAKNLNIHSHNISLYGDYIGKVDYTNLPNSKSQGKLILVTATTHTTKGIGKTTTLIGLVDALNKLGKKTSGSLREPALGPVFGIKGGACGGGYSQVYPMENINLHFTGDIHALTTLNNLIAAVIDNHIFQGNSLDIDSQSIIFNRAIDINDRTLRNITIGEDIKNQIPRNDHYHLTVATEIMAIFTLAKNLEDFTKKVNNIIFAYSTSNNPLFIKDLNISGSIAALIKDAINPNLVQTLEGNPVFIHGGPFANIAHGTSSLIATKTAMKLNEFVVCEAGFGADLGSEKFINLVSRKAGFSPDLIVITTTLSSLREHGSADNSSNSTKKENLITGFKNLQRNIDILETYQLPFLINLNKHINDSEEDIKLLENYLLNKNYIYSINTSFSEGSIGSLNAAKKIIDLTSTQKINPIFTYELEDSLETKLEKIITKIYQGSGFELSNKAKKSLEQIQKLKLDKLPLCIAKTAFSLSDDGKKKNAPTNFKIYITDIKLNNGAQFIIIYAGNIITLPGLNKNPNVNKITYNFKTNEINNLN